MIDEITFETPCGKFFRSVFKCINGYDESPELDGKNPDFKIFPYKRDIYFEIYRPEASKIKALKDKRNWNSTNKGKYIVYSLSLDVIKSVTSLFIKEKKQREQLPKDKPNILIIDLTHRFEESVHISDLISFEDSDIEDIFRIMPTLSGVIFYGLATDPVQTKHIKLLINSIASNPLTKEEKKIIEDNLK